MFWWIIQTILFSILFILLAHHIFNTLKSTLTVSKVKDVVNSRNQKYEEICSIVANHNPENNYNNNTMNNINSYTLEELLPNTESDNTVVNTLTNANSMKNELKHFLKTQLNVEESHGSTEISDLQPYSL